MAVGAYRTGVILFFVLSTSNTGGMKTICTAILFIYTREAVPIMQILVGYFAVDVTDHLL